MKTLILRDETHAGLLRLPGARALLDVGTRPEPLPEPKELHALARSGGAPEAFALQRQRMEAISDAQDDVRERMHALIREAHARGVGPAWLARWSGYDPSHVYAILDQK